MQRHAGALDAVEYKLAFETSRPLPSVGEPIAGHVRHMLAICQASDVQRPSLTPFIHALATLHDRDDERRRAFPCIRQVNQCQYCHAPNSLIVREYVSVCQACGYENESCRIQERAVCLPAAHVNCGSAKDARKLDVMFKDVEACLDDVETRLHRLHADGHVNKAQERRATYLATLYILEDKTQTRRKCPLIAVSCAIFALLETWAAILVPVQVFAKGHWTTKWVMPTVVFHAKKRKQTDL